MGVIVFTVIQPPLLVKIYSLAELIRLPRSLSCTNEEVEVETLYTLSLHRARGVVVVFHLDLIS